MKKALITGAQAGSTAWLVYAEVELFLTIILPQFLGARRELMGWQWPLIALISGVYLGGGLLLGVGGGGLLNWMGRGSDAEQHRVFAGLTLSVAFVVNLLTGPKLNGSGFMTLTVALGLALIGTASLAWKTWRRHTTFLANPLAVSILLLAAPWTHQRFTQQPSGLVKAVFIAGILAAVLALTAFARRIHLGQVVRTCPKVVAWGSVFATLGICVSLTGTAYPIRPGPPAAQATAEKPNILLITMDTVRADHLSLYGYGRDTTPRLRDFAREATVYRNAIAASSFTLPSHASIFTGLYPSWHGAVISLPQFPHGQPLAGGSVTLAGLLRKNGYQTIGIAANLPYLQANTGLSQGFDTWDVQLPVCLSVPAFYLREGVLKLLHFFMNTAVFDTFYLRAGDINQRAFAALDELRDRGPFFMFLNYMDAHVPYVPPAPFYDAFPGRSRDFRPFSAVDLTTEINSGKRSLQRSDQRHLVSQYDGGIAYMDSQIGKLLARLRELNLYDNTLILITSDHGEAFAEHGVMQHGVGSVYDVQLRIPLIVKYPGQHEGLGSDARASHVDITPTVLDVAGYAPPQGLQGQSLLEPRDNSAAVYAEAKAFGEYQAANPRLAGARRALYVEHWKLITPTRAPPELYNLANDPGESHNQYRSGDSVSSALMARMNAWSSTAPRRPNVKPSPKTMEQIKSLGYIQSEQ